MLKHRNELSFGHPDGHSVFKQNCIMPMNEAYQDMTQHTAIIFHVMYTRCKSSTV